MDHPKKVAVRLMDQSLVLYEQTLDIEARTLILRQFGDSTWEAAFSYHQPEPDVLTLEGTLDGKRVRIRCRRIDESRFPLVGRGFHWISERPFLR